MTQDPIEVIGRFIASIDGRDCEAIESFYAPDASWDSIMGVFEGRRAIRDYFENWFGDFDGMRTELEEALDLGNGVCLVVNSQRGRPVGVTGVVRHRQAWVITLVDGLIVRQTSYLDTQIDEARAAAERLAKERR